MCGFVGFWELEARSEHPIQLLQQMSDSIIHRGPDAGHEWFDGISGIGFAHRRLSIVDLTIAGQQPMHSANHRYAIVFNGENFCFIPLIEKGQS